MKNKFLKISTLALLTCTPLIGVSCSKSNNDPEEETKPPLENLRYGFEIDGKDEYTQRIYTNEVISFEKAIENGNDFVKNNLSEIDIKSYIETYVGIYAKRFQTMNTNNLNWMLEENNIKLNANKTISGNIKVKFTYISDLTPSLMSASRKSGDIEYHNFVFENSKIEAYINTSISNTLSFKIQTKWLQKQLISKADSSKNFNIGIKNEFMYLDDIDDLTLQLNDSIFNIDINKYVENMYLYSIANTNEKALLKEVLTKICSRNISVLVLGISPITNNTISAPILEIELSEGYLNIRSDFLRELTFELASLFNFVKSLKPAILRENKLYIDSGATLTNYKPSDKLIYDLSNSLPIDYLEIFREYKSINIFQENFKIKERLIQLQKSTIATSSWKEYITSLSDRQKAELIYKWLLPYVSYGQSLNDVSQIGGFVNNGESSKVLCEGYAHLFQYMGNILQTKTIGITGLVMANANPDEPAQPGKHAWNLININGTWLWCDPTWDDSMLVGSDGYNDVYFLKTTEEFFTPTTHSNVENWSNGQLLPIKI